MTNEGRPSFYTVVHKGVRRMLCALLERAGRTDFGDVKSVLRLRHETADLFELLELHAHHEDAHVAPLLRATAPACAASLASAHAELESRMVELLETIDAALSDPERARARGARFALSLSRYVGEQLAHMADEEEIAMPALWAALSDEQIVRAHRALVASLAPADAMRMYRHMLPAMSAPERAEMLAAMRAGAPPEAFAAIVALAREVVAASELGVLEGIDEAA